MQNVRGGVRLSVVLDVSIQFHFYWWDLAWNIYTATYNIHAMTFHIYTWNIGGIKFGSWAQNRSIILADLNLAFRYGIAIRIYASRKFWRILIFACSCNIDRQTAKFNSPRHFPAIRYIVINTWDIFHCQNFNNIVRIGLYSSTGFMFHNEKLLLIHIIMMIKDLW